MRPSEARRLARTYDLDALQRAAAALAEERDAAFPILGDDHGARLTHVLLAIRIRAKIDGGADERDAYRAVMADVRTVLTNRA
jgi:sensor histidine kinase regulating citrate/malate metabolism